MKWSLHFVLLFLVLSLKVNGQEISYISRSPRALLMGDAFTAVADDEYTLFYNPASLAKNRGVSFTLLDPTFGLTDALSELDRFENFPSGPGAAPQIANRIMDFPIYVEVGAVPTLKMGPFGISLFADNKTSLLLRNTTNPMLDVNYRYDRGFIFGYSHNILGSGAFITKAKKSAKSSATAGQRLSVGFAIKHMNRQGLKSQFDVFGTTILNSISSGSGDINAIKEALGYSKGKAWGYDTGVEYALSSGRSIFTAGLSIMDIGSTRFTKTEGTAELPDQEMMINSGISYKQDFGLFDYTLAADIRPINGMVDWSRKFHLGLEVSLPFITAFGGWSEGYLSYGGSFKVWPFKITTGFYSVEAGSKYREQEAKRFVLYLSLFDFSIDL